MARPRQIHVDSPCPRLATELHGLAVPSSPTSAATSANLLSRISSIVPPQEDEDLKYALGTLGYRKQRSRKRTRTGEFVWSDEADIIFTLALIAWTSKRANRVGARRSNFLQRFLADNGITKTRKQIASRLQVLKGEWRSTSYLALLEDPDNSGLLSYGGHTVSRSPSVGSEQPHGSYPCPPTPSTPPPTTLTPFLPHHGLNPCTYGTQGERKSMGRIPATLSSVLEYRQPIKSFHDSYLGFHEQQRQPPNQFPKQEDSLHAAGHHLQMHAPVPVVPHSFPTTVPAYLVGSPGFNVPQASFTNTYTSCADCGPRAIDGALGGSFRKTHLFTY